MADVLAHILESITPASGAQAAAARARLVGELGASELEGSLGRLVERLASARHSSRPAVTRKSALVIAADHGVASPGIDLGENNPTTVALRHLASGQAALSAAARSADANLVLVDGGIRGAGELDLGRGVLPFRIGDGTADITHEAAMSEEDAEHCLQTGIALVFSLADAGLDVLALGHLAVGGEPVSGAVIAALSELGADKFAPEDRDVIATALARLEKGAPALKVLAEVGGYELGILAGAILGAVSINVPVVLDSHGTIAAALIAMALAPESAGYLITGQRPSVSGHRAGLERLGLEPLFDMGLAHGEGTGAVLALPLIDAAGRIMCEVG